MSRPLYTPKNIYMCMPHWKTQRRRRRIPQPKYIIIYHISSKSNEPWHFISISQIKYTIIHLFYNLFSLFTQTRALTLWLAENALMGNECFFLPKLNVDFYCIFALIYGRIVNAHSVLTYMFLGCKHTLIPLPWNSRYANSALYIRVFCAPARQGRSS